ncbi:MAG: ABC transporter permease [Anaerolineae bacterium]
MMDRIAVIFKKEVVDNLRDRKTLAGSLFSPILGPLMMLVLFSVLTSTLATSVEKPLSLPVVGAENAPALVQFLAQNGATIQSAPADPEAAVREGNAEVVLVIPPDYGKAFTTGQPASVRLIIDQSRQTALVSIERARQLLSGYSREVGDLRLLTRGVDPNVALALAVQETNVATPQSQASLFLNILPYFIIFAIFAGGMSLVIDTIAGERERGSLEPLLINPVARSEFILGKLAAALVFTTFALIESLVAFYVVLNLLPTEALGIQIGLGLDALGLILLIALPIVLVACALQMIIATFTKSFKEAQNYLGLLPLIPALPGMLLGFMPIKAQLWMMFIPTLGQQFLINQVMRGETLAPLHILVSAVSTLVLGALCVVVAIKVYEREQVLVGR